MASSTFAVAGSSAVAGPRRLQAPAARPGGITCTAMPTPRSPCPSARGAPGKELALGHSQFHGHGLQLASDRPGPSPRPSARGGIATTAVVQGKPQKAGYETYNNGKVAKVPPSRIRNFSIIAHIDHGKSTLADTLLAKTGTVESRDMQAQFLDSLDLERERGITIKLNQARMKYTCEADGETYCLNLIDTPGHVDFSYEVSRSLAACEGALLVVDAAQGVETLANVYLALEAGLEIIPVINKIDLPGAEPDRVKQEIEDIIGLDCSNALLTSAKAGIGMEELLEAIVEQVPPPVDTRDEKLRALIFDSYYDAYRGVVVYFRVVDGTVRKGDKVRMMNTKTEYYIGELGVMSPGEVEVDALFAGEVGYMICGIKSVVDARVGDTITMAKEGMQAEEALPGYAVAVATVYCGLFTTDTDKYPDLREALEKLQLNDAALNFEPETSTAMGFGFRCGFLGLLHMEIVQERLEREYNLDLITTAPSVIYRVTDTKGAVTWCSNPASLPEPSKREMIEEPFVAMEVITPKDYVGTLMELCQDRRGIFKDMTFMTELRTSIKYEMPLSEVVTDFFDEIKSRTKGYASMEYSLIEYRKSNLIRLDVLLNGEMVDPLSLICHKDDASPIGRALCKKLKEIIPRQQFKIPIQAAIGGKVVASEGISALRKDVLAKCYGGDVSRKKKLLNAQAKGKKRMKAMGKVEMPQEAFMAVLKLDKSKGDE